MIRINRGTDDAVRVILALPKHGESVRLPTKTINLDSITENLVLDALHDLMHEKTSLLITHRLIRLENMAEILVLDKGCIVERGTHHELLSQKGLYWRLFELQNRILVGS